MSQIDRVLRSNLKLRHLQLLVALDEFRHLGRVAEFLSVTQPAVSKVVSEIESMFGLTLFERSTRGTNPTTSGASVIRFARIVLAEYERTKDEIAAAASGAAGRVSVGAMVVATPVLLARAVQLLKQASPQSTVFVEEGDPAHLLPELRVGTIDLFVGRLEPAYAARDIEMEALYNEPMTVVVRSDHPLANKAVIHWSDLAASPMVMPPPYASLRAKLDQLLLRHTSGAPPDLIETASFLATLTFVREQQAVGFMARSVAKRFEREGLVRILKLAIPLALPPIGIITLRGRRATPTIDRMIECLRRAARG